MKIQKLKKQRQSKKNPLDKSIPVSMPISLRALLRNKVDWGKFVTTLQDMAFGGKQVMNYNGQLITSQPNLDALRLMAEYAWGRPAVEGAEDQTEAIKKVSEVLTNLYLPKKEDLEKKADTNV